MTASARSFSQRYRAMRSRWNEDWWSIVFAGPIGNVLNASIADVSWITPNGLTLLGFALRLIACVLVVDGFHLAAIVTLQSSVVLDCMDGSLARYRGASSPLGAFLDKLTDALDKALDDEGTRKRLLELGSVLPDKSGRGQQALATLVKSEIEVNAQIVKAAGIEVN